MFSAETRNKLVVDKLNVDFTSVAATNATELARFLSEVVNVRQLISQSDLALYEALFASDPVALSKWEKLSKRMAEVE